MNSKQEGSPVFGPLTNHKAVAVKCILGSHRNCQVAVLKTNHGGHQGGINNFTNKCIASSGASLLKASGKSRSVEHFSEQL